jgi:hypothetical protein
MSVTAAANLVQFVVAAAVLVSIFVWFRYDP